MWSYKPEDPATLLRFYDTTHDKLWQVLFKPQKDWSYKEEYISLDATYPPQEVIQFYSLCSDFFLLTRNFTLFFPAFAELARESCAD